MKIIIALLVVLVTACVSNANARLETLERRLVESEEQNRRLRILQMEMEDDKSGAEQSEPDSAPTAAPAQAGAQTSTGAMWARQRHGVYMGTVGATPRQVTQGRKLHLDNQVCDRGSRDTFSRCIDADDNGSSDLNTWLAFEIDGQPVICDSGYFHPEAQVSLVRPGQACYVELGGSRTVDLTIMAYRNSGTATYVILDSVPYATRQKRVSAGNRNIVEIKIGETTLR